MSPVNKERHEASEVALAERRQKLGDDALYRWG